MPDVAKLGDAVKSAVEKGIPTYTINSGLDVFQSLGVRNHVGQDEVLAGERACLRLQEAGATKILAVSITFNHGHEGYFGLGS